MRKILKNVKIITCNKDNEVIENGVIILENDKISKITTVDNFHESIDGRLLDLKGKTAIPGLINSHIHFTLRRSIGSIRHPDDIATLAFKAIRSCLNCFREGVTTARDVAHRDEVHVQLKNSINQGIIVGPRIKTAGDALVMSYGHANFLCRQIHSKEELIKELRRQINDGADFIKIIASHDDIETLKKGELCIPWFSADELKIASDITHSAGLKITAHANGTETIKRVIEADFDCIEHGIYLNQELSQKMKEKNIFLVPTLTGYKQNADPVWNRGEFWAERYAILWKEHSKGIQYAIKNGVKLAVGTDTLGTMQEEIELLIKFGLSPLEALRAATVNGAELLDMDNIGSIEQGKFADIVIVEGDFLAHRKNLPNIYLTIKGGIEYSPQIIENFIPKSDLYATGS